MVINGQQIYWECGRRRQFITSEHLLVKYVKKLVHVTSVEVHPVKLLGVARSVKGSERRIFLPIKLRTPAEQFAVVSKKITASGAVSLLYVGR